MRLLLIALVFFLVITDAFSLELSVATGLSVKNGFLYLIALFLAFRALVNRGEGLQMRGIHIIFTVLIGYALFSIFAAVLLVHYPHYHLTDAVVRLKSTLVDQFIFFLVFFHGVRTAEESFSVLKALLVAVVFANFITLVNGLGLLHIGAILERSDGRVQGAVGESNQYAAFISCFLPAMFAMVATSRGLRRFLWSGALLISAGALLMTVSRGAMVGLVVGGLLGVWLMRRLVPPAKVAVWTTAAVLVGAVVVLALSLQYGALLEERLFQRGADMNDLSSGRTEIWATLLARMLQTPMSFLSGFGWDVYWSMPFYFSPHNHYLSMWFHLGLPGLVLSIALLALAIGAAKSAAERAPDLFRPHLMAFVFGALMIAVATFFVDLYRPWDYFWAYTGLMLRIVVALQEQASAAPAKPALSADPFGWTVTPRRVFR